MDTVTYPSERVQQELKANWTTIKIDVAQREHVAGICGIHAIPTVLALHPDGRVAGRILGFVAPNVFASQLTELRAK